MNTPHIRQPLIDPKTEVRRTFAIKGTVFVVSNICAMAYNVNETAHGSKSKLTIDVGADESYDFYFDDPAEAQLLLEELIAIIQHLKL